MQSHPTRREALLAAGATLTGASMTTAAALPDAKPEAVGLDAKQLQVAYDLLAKWSEGPEAPIPAGSILVGRHGKIVPSRFFGRQVPGPDAPPIRKDGLFLLASITKPITYLGAMILVERGLLQLSERVTRFLPEFKAHNKEDVLVRQLFTHTSGLPDMLPDNLELRRRHAPLQRFLDGAVKDTELLFKPGTEVRYQSMGTAVVAEIIQRLSGLTISEYLKKEVFDPLGLKSTALGAKGLDRDRIVRVQEQGDHASDFGWNSDYWHNLGVPWGGLFTSPEDFAVICQMLLGKGTYNAVKLLSPATVKAMTTNRLNEEADLPDSFRRTQPWGLGWRLNHPGTAGSWGDILGPNVFGHSGATGTLAWIDPDADGFCLIFTTGLHSKNHHRLVAISNAIAAAFV